MVNIWEIEGYKGYDDPDPHQVNTRFNVAMDSRITKEEVVEFFCNKYSKKYRCVSFSATLMDSKTI